MVARFWKRSLFKKWPFSESVQKHWKYKRFFTYATCFPTSHFIKNIGKQTVSYFLRKSKIALLAESQKCLFLKTSTFWKSFKNHYTKWCFRFSKPGKSKHFCDWSQKAFVFAGGVEAKMILFQKCPIPMVRNHQKDAFWKVIILNISPTFLRVTAGS